MKKYLLIPLIAILAIGTFNADAQKRSKHRTTTTKTTKKTSSTVNVKPTITEKKLEQNGMTLVYQRIEAPAYYKVPKDDAFFSNGYSDDSFYIDWPISLNGQSTTKLQNFLLKTLIPKAKNINDVVKSMTKCDYNHGKRVAKMPNSDGECLRNILDVVVYRLTPNLIGYEWKYDGYFGGGTSASIMYGSTFYNYDIANDRVLTADLCFKPGIENVIANQLSTDNEIWEMLWDEYKNNPSRSDNFKIDDNAITFYFPKYEIAPGVMGEVEVEVPMDKVRPYATSVFMPFITEGR